MMSYCRTSAVFARLVGMARLIVEVDPPVDPLICPTDRPLPLSPRWRTPTWPDVTLPRVLVRAPNAPQQQPQERHGTSQPEHGP
jgi:hypothetical protein